MTTVSTLRVRECVEANAARTVNLSISGRPEKSDAQLAWRNSRTFSFEPFIRSSRKWRVSKRRAAEARALFASCLIDLKVAGLMTPYTVRSTCASQYNMQLCIHVHIVSITAVY